MILKQRLFHDQAVITLDDEVTIQSAARLCEQMRTLTEDYKYEHIEILIPDSPGGLVTAMEMIGRKMASTQARGVTLSTFGMGLVASAAAITLSRGTLGKRVADEGAMLLYHLGRVQTSSQVTAKIARQMVDRLDRTDERVLESLVTHILPLAVIQGDAGTPAWKWPLEPVEFEAAQHISAEQRVFETERECLSYMVDTLGKLFEVDALMSPATAKALGLIDQIRQ